MVQKQRLLWLDDLLTLDPILSEEDRNELVKEVFTYYTGSLDGLVKLQTDAITYQIIIELVDLIEEDTLTPDKAASFWSIIFAILKSEANKKLFFLG